VGGVGGGDVCGDGCTDDGGAAAAASSTAAYHNKYGDERTNDVGAAAAASSTAAYRDKYDDDGSCIDGCGSDNDDVIDLLDDDPDLHLTPPNTDIDDDDYVDIDSDSEDEARTSFPKNKKPSKNLIIGGHQPADTTGMSAIDAKLTKEVNRTLRKQWSDKIRLQRLKENKVGSPPRASLGNINENLRVMVDVEANRLSVGHMFPIKNIFWLRIAEEALLRGINVRSVRSDYTNLIVTGPSFYVSGRFREGLGWKCAVAVCREGDDTSHIPPNAPQDYMSKAPLKTALTYQWVIPIIRQSVEKNPGIQYEALRGLIWPYAKEYAITTSDARDAAKKVIFGIAEDNVCYAEGVVVAMRELGHSAELVYTSRDETLAAINTIVIYEEIN